MEELFEKFVTTFQGAIRQEMEAMRARAGNFEVPVSEGEPVAGTIQAGWSRHRFKVERGAERLAAGMSCALKSANVTHLAQIEAIDPTRVTLVISAELNVTQGIVVVYPWFLYEKLLTMLETLTPNPHALRMFGKLPATRAPRELRGDHPSLNASQLAAVRLANESELSFVWGPPGTGKTMTLGSIVAELFARKARILVASTTNAALDQALSRSAAQPVLRSGIDAGEVVRLGRTEADTHGASLDEVARRLETRHTAAIERLKARQREVLPALRRTEQLLGAVQQAPASTQRSLFGERAVTGFALERWLAVAPARLAPKLAEAPPKAQLAWLARRIQRLAALGRLAKSRMAQHEAAITGQHTAIVEKARVVFSTLTNVYFSAALAGQRFDVVLVDEASMATLPNLFYAGCLATEQVILVGDPRQLPPIVQSSVPQVRRALGRTIFDVTVPEPETSPLVVMLDTQYRMHPSIAQLVSDLYYGGKLKTGVSRESLAAITEGPPHASEALVLLDTASTTACQARTGGSSRTNPAAAALAVELARQALRGGAESVAVITPYADQSREIQSLLRRHTDAGAVECSTVHRFQGRERDVVILDLVDTSPLRPGVLLAGASSDGAAERLLNVSLSRARGKLVIVADVAYFLREAPNTPVARVLERVATVGATRRATPANPART